MSSLRGGPIDVLTWALAKYLPLTDSGLFLAIANIRASKFCFNASGSKERLPILFMMKEPSLTRNSIKPCFEDLTVSISSCYLTRVPLLTFGIRPFGPRTRAIALSVGICSGVAMILSKGILPSPISFRIASLPIKSAPAALHSSWNSSLAKTHTLTVLPVPAGSKHVPRMFWSPFVGSTFSLIMTSKVSANFRSFDISLAFAKI